MPKACIFLLENTSLVEVSKKGFKANIGIDDILLAYSEVLKEKGTKLQELLKILLGSNFTVMTFTQGIMFSGPDDIIENIIKKNLANEVSEEDYLGYKATADSFLKNLDDKDIKMLDGGGLSATKKDF